MGKKCGRCGCKLIDSIVEGYDYTCENCDEDFYEFERFVIDEDEYSSDELKEKIDYLERLMDVCSVGTSELRELEELKKKLLESEEE